MKALWLTVVTPAPCEAPGMVSQVEPAAGAGLWLLCAYKLYHRDALGNTSLIKQVVMPPELRPDMTMFVDRRGRLWLWGRWVAYIKPDGTEGPRIDGTERFAGAVRCSFAEDAEGIIREPERATTVLTVVFLF